jgi:hypothetical protein
MRIFFILLVFLASHGAFAKTLDGIDFSDQLTLQGKTLRLNGLGIRKATFLKIKVYVAGLYVEMPTHTAQAIIDLPEAKRLELHFLREVDADKIRSAWSEGFKANCGTHCTELDPALLRLNALMEDIQKGDLMAFNFFPEKTEVWIKGKFKGAIESAGFAKYMLSVWLGEHPPNEDLKSGLLGN